MGWRFRKSIGILPGVRVNISKSGLSTSLGERGATVNIGQQGTRGSVGLPGSGLSYSRRIGSAPGTKRRLFAWAVPIIALLFWGVSHLIGGSRARPAAPVSAAASTSRSAAQSAACACGGDEVCTGPRGGHYCVASDGRKRYRR